MATYKNTDKIISHLNDEIEACGNPDSDNEPIAYGTKLGLLSAKAFIETAETADVQEVRHGKWIGYPSITISKRRRTVQSIIYKCSCCGKSNGRAKSPYCPNCGAKLDKE